MNQEFYVRPYTKINQQWIKNLNMWPETITLLEENCRETLQDTGIDGFLGKDPRGTGNKDKIDRHDYSWLRSLCTQQTKGKISRMGENICKLCNF